MTRHDVGDSVGSEPDDARLDDVEFALRRALSRPPTDDELGGWDSVAAGYRRAFAVRRSRRLRLAAGLPLSAAAAAAMLVPAGAVAAAYTGRLPAHVQHWAHKALAPIGVPARHHRTSTRPQPVEGAEPSTAPAPHVAPRDLATRLPTRQHAKVVTLCITLRQTRPENQRQLLTSLHQLLPHEKDLHNACRILLPTRTPGPTPSEPQHRAPTASPRPFPSSSAGPAHTPTAAPSPTPTPTPTS